MNSPSPDSGATWLADAAVSGRIQDERADAFALEAANLAGAVADHCLEGHRTGIYAAMGDAGMAQASALWADARTNGPAFANPAAFPWTLASSVAARVAVALKARGPNITFSGDARAAFNALATAVSHLETGRIDRAVVIAADAGGGPAPWPLPAITLVVLGPAAESGRARLHATGHTDRYHEQPCEGSASSWLQELCLAVESGDSTVVGSELDGRLELTATPSLPDGSIDRAGPVREIEGTTV